MNSVSFPGEGAQSCTPMGNLPEGLFLDLFRTKVFRNEGDGVYAEANGSEAGGIVGGTRYWDGSSQNFFYHTSGTMELPGGQGRIVACEIHNNFGRGIHIEAQHGAASFRLVRSVLWNNNMEGWLANFGLDPANTVACPVVFNTFAGNGDDPSANANVSIFYGTPTPPFFALPGAQIANARKLHTKFLHNIFQRKNAAYSAGNLATRDFGGAFQFPVAPQVYENPLLQNGAFNVVYMTGNSSGEDLLGLFASNPEWWVSNEALLGSYVLPFEGPVVWSGENPEQFRLKDLSGDQIGNVLDDARAGVITNWIGELLIPSTEFDVDLRGVGFLVPFSGTDTSRLPFDANKGAFIQ